MTLSHFFFFLLLVEITWTFNPGAVSHDSPIYSKPRGIVLNLFHRNSVLSPYYTPKATQWDLTREAITASLARARSYSQKNGGVVNANGGVPVLSDQTGETLIAKISVGQPPVEQFLMIDTGSSITWIHCEPCPNCPKQPSDLFNPRRSSTYSSIPCEGDNGSKPCEAVGGKCDDSRTRCLLKIGYVDGTNVKGVFAKETVVFGDLSITVNTFGCANSHTVERTTTFDADGILGLGLASSSILGQFDFKLSYCMGNLHDPTYQYHKLFLGDAAKLDAPATPIVSELYGRYYVDLEGISFNKAMLDIDSIVFKLTATGSGGVVLDCGSSLTYLEREAYDPLATAAAGFLDKLYERVPHMIDHFFPGLCYKGSVDKVITNPIVTLHFNGAEMELAGRSLFFDQEGVDAFCLSIVPAEEFLGSHALNVIGTWAQQSYSVGFDGNAKKVHFRRVDCKDL